MKEEKDTLQCFNKVFIRPAELKCAVFFSLKQHKTMAKSITGVGSYPLSKQSSLEASYLSFPGSKQGETSPFSNSLLSYNQIAWLLITDECLFTVAKQVSVQQGAENAELVQNQKWLDRILNLAAG